MANTFRESRNVELSMVYYLKTCLNADWSGVTTMLSFSDVYSSTVKLPVVCVELTNASYDRQEIGATTLNVAYQISVDIFANSDAQRLDLADYVREKMKEGCVYYLHSRPSGAQPNTPLDMVDGGRLFVTDFIDDSKVSFGEDVDDKDRYRHTITFRVATCLL